MIDKLIKPIGDILDKFVADKDLKLKLSHELEKEIISLNKLQIELNKEDAKGHWFQSSYGNAWTWWTKNNRKNQRRSIKVTNVC